MLNNCIETLGWLDKNLIGALQDDALTPERRTVLLKAAMLSTLLLANTKHALPNEIKAYMDHDLSLSRNTIAHQKLSELMDHGYENMIRYIKDIVQKYSTIFNQYTKAEKLTVAVEAYGNVPHIPQPPIEIIAVRVMNALTEILSKPNNDGITLDLFEQAAFIYDLISLGELVPILSKQAYIDPTVYKRLTEQLNAIRHTIAHHKLDKPFVPCVSELYTSYAAMLNRPELLDSLIQLKHLLAADDMSAPSVGTDEVSTAVAKTTTKNDMTHSSDTIEKWKLAYSLASSTFQRETSRENRFVLKCLYGEYESFMTDCAKHAIVLNEVVLNPQILYKTQSLLSQLNTMNRMLSIIALLMTDDETIMPNLDPLFSKTPHYNNLFYAYAFHLASDINFETHILPHLSQAQYCTRAVKLFKMIAKLSFKMLCDRDNIISRLVMWLEHVRLSSDIAEALFIEIASYSYSPTLMDAFLRTQTINKNNTTSWFGNNDIRIPYLFLMAYYAQDVNAFELFKLFIASDCDVNQPVVYQKGIIDDENTLLLILSRGHMRRAMVTPDNLLVDSKGEKLYMSPEIFKCLLEHPNLDVNFSYPKPPLVMLVDKISFNKNKNREKSQYPVIKFQHLICDPRLNLNPSIEGTLLIGGVFKIPVRSHVGLQILRELPSSLCIDYFNAAKQRGVKAYHAFLHSLIDRPTLMAEMKRLITQFGPEPFNKSKHPFSSILTLTNNDLHERIRLFGIVTQLALLNHPLVPSLSDRKNNWTFVKTLLEHAFSELLLLEALPAKRTKLNDLESLFHKMPDGDTKTVRLDSVVAGRQALDAEAASVELPFTYAQFGVTGFEAESDVVDADSISPNII